MRGARAWLWLLGGGKQDSEPTSPAHLLPLPTGRKAHTNLKRSKFVQAPKLCPTGLGCEPCAQTMWATPGSQRTLRKRPGQACAHWLTAVTLPTFWEP